jgi:predicted small metal-binding protein
MKSMTCRQLGGACDHTFQANSFEEMVELSKKHGTEMFQKGDEAHINAMQHERTYVETTGYERMV